MPALAARAPPDFGIKRLSCSVPQATGTNHDLNVEIELARLVIRPLLVQYIIF